MNWKYILKADLPARPPIVSSKTKYSSPIRNVSREAMDAWAKEYEQKLIRSISKIGEKGQSSSWMKIDSQMRNVTLETRNGKNQMDYSEYANTLKRLVRAVKYGQFKKSNYAFRTEEYLRDTDLYVSNMMMNSTASEVLFVYIKE